MSFLYDMWEKDADSGDKICRKIGVTESTLSGKSNMLCMEIQHILSKKRKYLDWKGVKILL